MKPRLLAAAALACFVASATPTDVASPAVGPRQAFSATTFDDEVVAPGRPTRADLDAATLALAQPPSSYQGLQAVSVGGSISWGEFVSQSGPVPGGAETGDGFGTAVVVADFDDDGIDDLVAGSPGEAIGTREAAGAISFVPGGVRAFSVQFSQGFSQAGPMAGAVEADDRFGAALAAGDFDNDGNPELVVGAPGEDIGSRVDAGAVTVVPADIFGLAPESSVGFSQSSPGVPGAAEADDRLGAALAVGDFDGDGFDDLLIGAPGEDIDTRTDAGAVVILYGGPTGLTGAGAQLFSQASSGIAGKAEAGDRFGAAVAAADVNGDGFDDAVIGVPGEDVQGATDTGLVAVLFGSAAGIGSSANMTFGQYSTGISGAALTGDRFGAAVAAADLDGDGQADIAVGIPGKDVGGDEDAGAVGLFYADDVRIDTTNEMIINQDTAGVAGGAEDGDGFGSAVLLADVLGTGGHPDLVVGVPEEDVGNRVDAGAVALFPGTGSGPAVAGDVLLTASSSGVPGAAEAGDLMGYALAAGDLNGDSTFDLALGVPGEGVGPIDSAGMALSLDPRAPIGWSVSDQPDDFPGDQIHVIYAIPADKSEARGMDAAIRTDVAIVDEWYRQQLGNRDLRWDTRQGALDLSTVQLTATEAEIAGGPSPFDIVNLEAALQDLGFDDFEKGYVVYYEGQGSSSSTCGVTFAGDIAVLWLDACGGVYPEFTNFPFGSTYLHVHELTHLLGAVEPSAPNHCCQGHLDDDNRDVLFQNPVGDTVRDWDNLRLDPGNDDYFEHPGAWFDIADSDFVD